MTNVIGYLIDVDPCPIIVAQPTLDLARYYSKARLAPAIRASRRLARKVSDPKSRDSDNTTLSKGFVGGQIDIVGAKSAGELSGRPARFVLADEIDRYEDTAEGDPLQLLEARTSNFWNAKRGFFSSPRDKHASRIEEIFNRSDRRKWWVPCPHCGKHQVLKWEQVRWDKATEENGRLAIDDQGRHIHYPNTARYYCQHCAAEWSEPQRHAAIAAGHWRAEKAFKGIAGFWLSGLYSPWQSLARLAGKFLDAKLPGAKRVFINTVLCETWEEQGEIVDADDLLRRAEDMGGVVPNQVLLLTGAVDVQDDRLELEVVGWGPDEERWQIIHRQLYGDPAGPELWDELGVLLGERFVAEDGVEMVLRAVGVDTGGHHTSMAYNFCRPRWRQRVWALKGAARGLGNPIWPRVFSKKNKGNVPLFTINVDEAKKVVKDRLAITEPGPGYFHFPVGLPPAFYEQYKAEKLVTRYKDGFAKRIWHKTPGKPNEALDLAGYNYAVLCGLYAHGLKLEREARRRARMKPPDTTQTNQTASVPPSGGTGGFGGAVLPSDPYLQT